ncbi:MAG: hypothetical protein K2X66_06835 [Cyanobacteria bacterium]|nr:hypothetical protein [Cyanobacteriota bacterium]
MIKLKLTTKIPYSWNVMDASKDISKKRPNPFNPLHLNNVYPKTVPQGRKLAFAAIDKALLLSPQLVGKKLQDRFIHQNFLVTAPAVKLFDACYDGADNYRPPLYQLNGVKLDAHQRPTGEAMMTLFENDDRSQSNQFNVIA